MSQKRSFSVFATVTKFLLRIHLNLKQTEQIYMVLVSLFIGLLGGLGSVGFRKIIHLLQRVSWGTDSPTLEYLHALPGWWKLLAPAGGGLVVGLVIYYFASEAKGHGVPEVMESVALRGGRIRPRVVVAKLFASGVCIASGGSVGREGPIVQIGSAIGSTIGQWLGVGQRRLRTLVGCGAAAGIAGTFNAPVAGALFAVEILLGDFGVSQFSPIVISSVAATVVGRHFLGDTPAFEVHPYSLVSAGELFAYAVLGIVAGLTALLFVRTLYGLEDAFDRLPLNGVLRAVIGGGLVGGIGLYYPEIFGVGYEAINQALRGELLWQFLLVLAAIKILAVGLTLGSGGSGGIFAPSLFIGAMVGGAVGSAVHSIWPNATGGPGAYALVGMGAVVAAGTHAPITAILIIFELTEDYKIILPLMISCIIATLLATRLQKASIYTLKLLRRGVDIREGQTINVLGNLKAQQVIRSDFVSVPPGENLMAVIAKFITRPGETVFVTDQEQQLLGVITIDDIRPIMADPALVKSLVIAGDMMREDGFPVFSPDDPLDEVMRRFGTYRFQTPAVKDSRVVGAIWPQDVIERYNAEVLKRDMASTMSLSVGDGPVLRSLPGVQGMSMAEISAPASFIGRNLATLGIRKRFGITVLLIKRKSGARGEVVSQLPDAGFTFQEGDVMLALGAEELLQRLERAG